MVESEKLSKKTGQRILKLSLFDQLISSKPIIRHFHCIHSQMGKRSGFHEDGEHTVLARGASMDQHSEPQAAPRAMAVLRICC